MGSWLWVSLATLGMEGGRSPGGLLLGVPFLRASAQNGQGYPVADLDSFVD